MNKAKLKFWIKSALLLAVVLACLWYLALIFLLEYFTVGPESAMGLLFYGSMVIHISIALICILYLYEKIRSWSKELF